jgi:O-antigen/teichoic acid export membrane protein
MAFGSLSVFIANLLFKEILSLEQYYNYSILIVFIALMNSFGLFGLEQVFIRITKIKEGVLEISKKNIQAIGLFTILNSFLFTWVLKSNYSFSENFILIAIMSILVISLLFFYNFFRLNSNFVIAQVAANSWKLYLGFAVIYTSLLNVNIQFHELFLGLLIALVTTTLYCLYLAKNIRVVFVDLIPLKEMVKLAIQFFISLLTLSFIAQSDKLIVDEFFGPEEFVNYFYLANLFLFPFSFIQSYIGFKEIVVMKKQPNYELLKASIKVLVFSVIFAFCLIIAVKTFVDLDLIKIDLSAHSEIILLFLVTGIIRLVYAIYSAYFSCFATSNDVKWANIYTIISILILLYIISEIPLNVQTIALFLTSIWLIRLIIWMKLSFKLKNKICATN